MVENKKIDFSLKSRIKSFKNAFQGLQFFVSTETNARIHVCAAVTVICLGLYFKVSLMEWTLLFFSIGLVIALEMINTAIELACDLITLDQKESIRHAKDIAAGAVLVASVVALLVGAFIFVPRISV